MRTRLALLVLAGLLLACLLLPACGCGGQTPATTIRVSGAWALYPMMVQWGEAYQKAHPEVRIDISAGGAGKGIADSLSGLVDIGMVSRAITPEEAARGAVYVPVARDAALAIMNAAGPSAALMARKGLPKEMSQGLWLRQQPITWGQLAGDSSTATVQVYTRSDSCGAAEVWANYLGGKQPDLAGIGVYGDPGIAEAVCKDVQGVGYSNLNYVYDAATGLPVRGLAVIPIDVNGNGRTDPEEELDTKAKAVAAIRSGAYPSPPARDLHLVVKGSFQGSAAAFVKWILTDGQQLVDTAGYIRISEAQRQEAAARIGK